MSLFMTLEQTGIEVGFLINDPVKDALVFILDAGVLLLSDNYVQTFLVRSGT